MTKSLFDSRVPHPEPSTLSAFARNGLSRLAEGRAEDCLETAFAVEGAHILAFAGNRLILKHDGQVLDPLFAPYELPELKPDLDNAVLLGTSQAASRASRFPSPARWRNWPAISRRRMPARSIARSFWGKNSWARLPRP